MSIELRLAELTAAITTLTETINAQSGAAPAPKAKAVKAKVEAAPVEAVQAVPTEAAKPEPVAAEAAPTLKLEDIMPAARKLVELQLGDKLVEILKTLSNDQVTKISLLPADKYAQFLELAASAEAAAAAAKADPLA